MNELQLLETWNDWDEINLSTLKLRQERLEILLCQKVKNGEDISQCLQALEYLNNQSIQQSMRDSDVIYPIRRKSSFVDNFERVSFIGSVIALVLCASSILCAAVLPAFGDSTTNGQTHYLTDSISKSFKRIKEKLHHSLKDEDRE